jgi:hypothetical protein
MNNFKYLVIGVISILCFITLLSGISHAVSIRFSKHDLSDSGGSNFKFETTEVCVFCHTPHGGNMDVRPLTVIEAYNKSASYQNTGAAGGAPFLLWNRAFSNAADNDIQEGYETYSSSTMNASTGSVRIYSILCLSCHDGVGALNVLTKLPGDATTESGRSYAIRPKPSTGSNQIGDIQYTADRNPNIGNRTSPSNTMGYPGQEIPVQLFNDHPISIDYTAALASDDGGLNAPSTIDGAIRLFTNPAGTPGVSLECPSCHNVHDQGGDPASSQFPFLVMSNAGSALCLECHNK